MPTAADIIAGLELRPHPEGGHYRETFRDTSADADGRARSTAIYYLLSRGERSHWHRIDIVEVWHYYAGNALTLRIAHDGGVQHTVRLGPDVATGDRPQAIVPANAWQAAETTVVDMYTASGLVASERHEPAGVVRLLSQGRA